MNASVLKEECAGNYFAKHGCAWFDVAVDSIKRDPNVCGGWYSVGGEKAQRFSSWKTLPKEIIWWTNLSKAESWSLGRWSTFKDGALFGPDWPAIMTESSKSFGSDALALGLPMWSEIFSRCAEWLASWAAAHDAENPWDWGEGSLADALAPRLGLVPKKQENIQPVLQNAYCEIIEQEIPTKILVGRRKVMLAYPRAEHSKKLWSVPHPKGDWHEYKDWSDDFQDRVNWLKEQRLPVLVRVDSIFWKEGHEANGRLWLGLRGRRFPAAQFEPVWMTGEEAKILNSYALLELGCAYLAEGWQTSSIPEGWSLGSSDSLVNLSWSQSLLSSSLWMAAASPTRDPKNRRKASFSSRAVWWRASDRIRCFLGASKLQERGFTVFSYGQGQIAILFNPDGKPEELAEAIQDAGLLMPELLARVESVGFTDFNNIVHVNRWLKKVGGSSTLIDIDRLVAPWAGKDVKLVLSAAAKRLISIESFPSPEWKEWWKDSLKKQARISVDKLSEKMKKRA